MVLVLVLLLWVKVEACRFRYAGSRGSAYVGAGKGALRFC